MKKSIFALLILISVNFLIAQNKCEENPEYSESEIIKLAPDAKKSIGSLGKFYFDDATVMCTKINRNTYLIQILDKDFKLKAEKQLKFNEKKEWALIETVLKKEDGFYFYIKGEGRKKYIYSEKKYDFSLNLISDRFILETPDSNFNNFAFQEGLIGLRFYNNDANFKISSIKKKEVFVTVFDNNLNKISEYSYTDEYNAAFRVIKTLIATFTSDDGSLYTLYDNPTKVNGKYIHKLAIRKISTNGVVTANNTEFKGIVFDEGYFVESLETSEEFTFVFTSSKNSKTYINGLSIITYNKSDLSIVSSKFVPIKKHKVKISLSDYALVKFEENNNDLYISIEATKDATPQAVGNGRVQPFRNFGNISIYKLDLKTKMIEWESKINKKNTKVFTGTGSDKHEIRGFISYSWVVKNGSILVLLNSNDKRTNNTFVTKQKIHVFDKKVSPSSLYAININTVTGKFCYKKFKEITDVIYYVNYGVTEDNSLHIVGENRAEKTYQILKL